MKLQIFTDHEELIAKKECCRIKASSYLQLVDTNIKQLLTAHGVSLITTVNTTIFGNSSIYESAEALDKRFNTIRI